MIVQTKMNVYRDWNVQVISGNYPIGEGKLVSMLSVF